METPDKVSATDIMVTPEGISWSVGPVFFTFNVQGHLEAHLIEDGLPEGATAKAQLCTYAAYILTAAISAGRAAACPTAMRGAILRMQALCATHGIDWENDPGALDKLDGLPAGDILKSVEAILS